MMDYATDVAASCWMYGLTMKQLKQLNQGEHMKSFEEIAKEAKLELTPEIRRFAWLVNQYALIDFWEAANRQAKYQQEVLGEFLRSAQ